jgi:hypothetical protein
MGVRQGLKSQPIPFRSELGDVLVFRTHVRTDDGVETSDHTALTYTKLNEWLKRLGTETGFVQVLTAYCLRRASGNAINGKLSPLYAGYDTDAGFCRRPEYQRTSSEPGYGSYEFVYLSAQLSIQDDTIRHPSCLPGYGAKNGTNSSRRPNEPSDKYAAAQKTYRRPEERHFF